MERGLGQWEEDVDVEKANSRVDLYVLCCAQMGQVVKGGRSLYHISSFRGKVVIRGTFLLR